SFVAMKNDVEDVAIQPSEVEEPMQEVVEEEIMPSAFDAPKQEMEMVEEVAPAVVEQPEEPKPEPEMQVIVLNVHCAGEEPFIGT
ncbi:hypothetical protein OFN42_38775, partial [Escherichia coli]|nr:hypothetical protein [Escherichia coli]